MIARRLHTPPQLRLARQVAALSTIETAPVFQFKCTQCGKCCTGGGGRVRVNESEIDELRRELRVPRDELEAKFLTRAAPHDGGDDALWLIKQTNNDAQCIFLRGNKCSVYPARPTQCRTFPWWPQNLISSYDWQLAARQCEGIQLTPGETTSDVYALKDVLPEAIVYDIHRSGENYTYSELHAMLRDLQDVDASFLDEYARELREKFHRRIVFQDESVTVLDTFLDGAPPTRCFVFNDRLQLVQSEMYLTEDDGETLDPSALVLDVHQAMTKALSWLLSAGETNAWRIAVLGSGGGSLVRYILHRHAQDLHWLDAVEPNAKVNEVARTFFGLADESRFTLHEAFGEEFVAKQLQNSANLGRYDLVVVDVEAGAPGDGVLAPPQSMLTPKFLQGVSELLSDAGVVVINVITESPEALRGVADRLLRIFDDKSGTRCLYVQLPKNTVMFLVRIAVDVGSLLRTDASMQQAGSLPPIRELEFLATTR